MIKISDITIYGLIDKIYNLELSSSSLYDQKIANFTKNEIMNKNNSYRFTIPVNINSCPAGYIYIDDLSKYSTSYFIFFVKIRNFLYFSKICQKCINGYYAISSENICKKCPIGGICSDGLIKNIDQGLENALCCLILIKRLLEGDIFIIKYLSMFTFCLLLLVFKIFIQNSIFLIGVMVYVIQNTKEFCAKHAPRIMRG